jgi:hypothetical protein
MSLSHHSLYAVNAAHLEMRDVDRLKFCGLDHFPRINAGMLGITEGGLLLWIGDEGLEERSAETLQEHGYSSALITLLDRVYEEERRFCYVLIVDEGGTVEGLPTFESTSSAEDAGVPVTPSAAGSSLSSH